PGSPGAAPAALRTPTATPRDSFCAQARTAWFVSYKTAPSRASATSAMSPPAPLCFVLMPFGTKASQGGGSIDFDKIYCDAIAPAIQDADLVPIRADEERTGGIIHKPMFERLLLGEYAI